MAPKIIASAAVATTRPALSDTRLEHLNQIQLARRWRISERTLERWRWAKIGLPYLRLGGRVAYRLEDIEAYEAARRILPSPAVRRPAK